MIDLPSQRTDWSALFYLYCFWITDIAKIVTATFLLVVMSCVLYERVMWLWVIEDTHRLITTHPEFVEHLANYDGLGEDWRSAIELLGIADSIVQKVDWIKETGTWELILSWADVIRPGSRIAVETVDKACRQLQALYQDLDSFLLIPSVIEVTSQLERQPSKESVVQAAVVYHELGVDLKQVNSKLAVFLAISQQLEEPFVITSNALENIKDKPGVNWVSIQPLIDYLHQGTGVINQVSDKISLYQSMTQTDAKMINSITISVNDAQRITASFGNGAWRRLTSWVYENIFLLLCANLALLVAEICLFMEQKNKV